MITNNPFDSLSSSLSAAFQSSGLTWLPALLLGVALVLTIVLYVVFVPHVKQSQTKGLKGFLNFDKLWIGPIIKFFYIFSSVMIVVFGITGIILVCGRYAELGVAVGDIVITALATLLSIVISLVLMRLIYELLYLTVKIVENTTAIRYGSATGGASTPNQNQQNRPHPAAQQGWAQPNPGPRPQAFSQVPVQGQTAAYRQPSVTEKLDAVDTSEFMSTSDAPRHAAPAQAAVSSGIAAWDCSCGARRNTGAFCGNCGKPKP